MRWLAIVLLLWGNPAFAQTRQRLELMPGAANVFANWTKEHAWELWAAAVLLTGIAFFAPGVAVLDSATTAPMSPHGGNGEFLAGGMLIILGVAATVAAAYILVHQSRSSWREEAYWQSR